MLPEVAAADDCCWCVYIPASQPPLSWWWSPYVSLSSSDEPYHNTSWAASSEVICNSLLCVYSIVQFCTCISRLYSQFCVWHIYFCLLKTREIKVLMQVNIVPLVSSEMNLFWKNKIDFWCISLPFWKTYWINHEETNSTV